MDIFGHIANVLVGRLTWHDLQHNAVTMTGVVIMTLALVAIVGALTYFKRWKWLWKTWVTSLDPKKIGVMYIIVSVIMLLRGVSDAVMMRAQQATSVGAAHGIVPSEQFQQVF